MRLEKHVCKISEVGVSAVLSPTTGVQEKAVSLEEIAKEEAGIT